MEFTYNHEGIRTQKVKKVNGEIVETTDYILAGKKIIGMQKGNDRLLFHYDESGSLIMLRHNGTPYTYVKNVQGDIVGLIDNTGALKVEYKYDAWGNPTATRTLTSEYEILAELNPFRYRGYVWDEETGFYYVSNRYYVPEDVRWINADIIVAGDGESVKGYDLFAYCFNNPVNMEDEAGNWPKWIKDAVKWVATNIVKPVVKSIQKTLSTVDMTYSTGINVSGTPSAWIFNGQIGVSMDTEGNVEIQASFGGGITGGDPSISVTLYQSITNAPNIKKLRGDYCQVGGSIAVPIEGIPVAFGGDIMFMPDPECNTLYYGITENVGFGTPGKEFHVEWGSTYLIPKTEFNVFELADFAYDKIMEW